MAPRPVDRSAPPRRPGCQYNSCVHVPADPRALAAALPDAPCWVETRALLLSGEAVVRHSAHADGALVLDPALPAGYLVGRANAPLLRDVLNNVAEDFELVVQIDALDDAHAALPGWTVAPATIHALASPWPAESAAAPGVVISAPPQQRWIELVPDAEEMRRYAALADAIALRVVDGDVVAVCAAGDVTESLWDVGIDTLDGHRRQGHATAAFGALAAHMAARGRQPVWGAEDDNVASMAMAARLGFEPAGRLAILKARRRDASSVPRDRRLVAGTGADPRGGGARRAEREVRADAREPDARHVAVDRLVLTVTHAVGLVPDADVAGAAHQPVERAPGREMASAGIAREPLEVLERAPVLHDGRPGREQPRRPTEEAGLGIALEIAEHPRHRHEHRQPAMDLPRLVDPHADEKDDEVSLDPR